MVVEMMDDVSDKGSDWKDISLKKSCVDCGTYKTPLWRGGPAGPKSLCNACGIRSRKKRRALLELIKADENKEKAIEKKMKHMMMNSNSNTKSNSSGSNINSSSSSSSNEHLDFPCKDRLMSMWDILKPQNVRMEELNEEQEAAVLLMAMSYGSNHY